MPKLTIVVPVYNAEKYIKDTLLSILNQTLYDIEVIVVDDGSNDKSADICKEIASDDDRLVFIQQENLGVSVARNLGIKLANSNLITFVDSDDLLTVNACELLYQSYCSYPADITVFNYSVINNSGIEKARKVFVSEQSKYITDDKELLVLQCINSIAAGAPENVNSIGTTWCKMYKTEFLRNNELMYVVGLKRGQDIVFNSNAFQVANTVYNLGEYLYFYRIGNEKSVMHKFIPDMYTNNMLMYSCFMELINKHSLGKNFHDALEAKVIQFIYDEMKNNIFHQDNKDKLTKRLSQLKVLLKSELCKSAVHNVNVNYINKVNRCLLPLYRYKMVVSLYVFFVFRRFVRKIRYR